MKPKKQRNRQIVRLVNKGVPMSEIARQFKLKAKSTVHEIYWREQARHKSVRGLSTVGV